MGIFRFFNIFIIIFIFCIIIALGYPWYHRASLDAWCGAYPSVAGHVTNCYNGAQKIAPGKHTKIFV